MTTATRIHSGMLRHEINIQSVTQTPDGSGGQSEVFSTVDTIWASIGRVIETEELNAGMLQNVTTHTIKIRFFSGLTVSHRILFGTRAFEIISIENIDERNIVQVLQCLERSV